MHGHKLGGIKDHVAISAGCRDLDAQPFGLGARERAELMERTMAGCLRLIDDDDPFCGRVLYGEPDVGRAVGVRGIGDADGIPARRVDHGREGR